MSGLIKVTIGTLLTILGCFSKKNEIIVHIKVYMQIFRLAF